MNARSERSIANYVSMEIGFVVARAKAQTATEFAYPLLTQKGFGEADKLKTIDFSTVFLTNEVSDKFLTRKGDVIVRIGAPYGAKAVGNSGTGILVTSAFMILRVLDPEKLSPAYLAYYLDRETRTNPSRVPDGAVLKPLSKEVLEKFEVTLPVDTQKKIATLWGFARKEQRLLAEIAAWKLKLSEAKIAKLEREGGGDA